LNTPTETDILYGLGTTLVFTGIAIMLLAILRLSLSGNKANGKTRSGGIILIGPVPIVFGIDKESVKKILLLALDLTVILIIAMIVRYSVWR
jgi:uncharacterized protein (TIGR00304 family)